MSGYRERIYASNPLPKRCRMFGHKFTQNGGSRGMVDTQPKDEKGVTRSRSYLWCFRCERYFPGSLEIKTTRRFP